MGRVEEKGGRVKGGGRRETRKKQSAGSYIVNGSEVRSGRFKRYNKCIAGKLLQVGLYNAGEKLFCWNFD